MYIAKTKQKKIYAPPQLLLNYKINLRLPASKKPVSILENTTRCQNIYEIRIFIHNIFILVHK